MMKFLSLFSGIGGFDLGLERAGMECVGQVEFNKFCIKVLEKHWPHVKRIGDIHDVKGDEFGTVDLICGGVPCQPASVAGKRKGTADDRWLWPQAFRIVEAVKPTWCLFENVSGLLTLENGLVFENLLSELENKGYEVQSFIIPACAVGAWHRRDRIWIVAYSERNGCENRYTQTRGQVGCGESRGMCEFERSNRIPSNTRPIGQAFNEKQTAGIKQQDKTNTHADSIGRIHGKLKKQSAEAREYAQCESVKCNANVRNSKSTGFQGGFNGQRKIKHGGTSAVSNQWEGNWLEAATRLCGSNDGVRNRVDRLKSLGNAVIPQIPEIIGKIIMEIEDNK